jgi:hypothetical protein
MSVSPSPNDLTRQQLDELDALLQKMLTLPLASGGADLPQVQKSKPLPMPEMPTVPSAPSGHWRTDAPSPTPKSPYIAAEPVPELSPAFVALTTSEKAVPAWGPDPLARYQPTIREESRTQTLPAPSIVAEPPVTQTVRGVDAPALPMNFRPEPLESIPIEIPLETPKPIAAILPENDATPSNRVPMPLWPVFALNWVIENILGLFGPLGTVSTHPLSKHFLGGVGMILIVAAGVWTARGLGWVSFPVPLPR